MNGVNKESWLSSTMYHLSQIGKGVLVAGMTLGGYGLWKRWGGEVVAPSVQGNDEQSANGVVALATHDHAKGLISLDTTNNFSAKSSSRDNDASIISQGFDKASALTDKQPLWHGAAAKRSTSLAEELGIRYWEEPHANLTSASEKKKRSDKPHFHTLATLAPTNAIPEQWMEVGQSNQLTLRGADFFSGELEVLWVTQASGASLPVWLTIEPLLLSTFFPPGLDSGNWVSAVGTTVFIGGDYGLQILNTANMSNPTLSYSTTGGTEGLSVVNNTAFMLSYSGLQILDITNSSNPTPLGGFLSEGAAYGISLAGNNAFVVNNFGLVIINVANTSKPALLGNYNTPGPAYAVCVVNDIAFVANGYYGLKILNVTNPSNVTLLVNYISIHISIDSMHGDAVYGVNVVDNIAFALWASNGLEILNVAHPTHPVLLSSYAMELGGSTNQKINVVSDTLFVGNANGLLILNVANPSNPIFMGEYSQYSSYNAFILGDVAFLTGASGLQILDLTELKLSGIPTATDVGRMPLLLWARNALGETVVSPFDLVVNQSPQQVQTALTDQQLFPGQKLSLQLNTNNLFLDPKGGWLALSAQQLSGAPLPGWLNLALTPTLLEFYDMPGVGADVIDVSVIGNTAFVANGGFGLQTLNVANPSNPILLGRHATQNYYQRMNIVSNTVFVADITGLDILDVADLSNPILIDSYTTFGYAEDVSLVGNIAFMACDSGLQILNVANLPNITSLGTYAIPEGASGVSIVGNVAFLACNNAGLQILNVVNPSNITFLGSYPTPLGGASDVSVVGNTAFLGISFGLQILDVTNTSNPTLIGSYAGPNVAAVSVVGHTVFLASTASGVLILNVANLSNPILLGGSEKPAYDMDLAGSSLYIAEGSGIRILDLNSWVFSGTPTAADAGNYPIQVTATDYLGGTVSSTFTIRVEGPPTVSGSIATQYAQANQLWNYFFSAGLFVDPNFNPLTYSAILSSGAALPTWLVFNGPSYQFSGTPTITDRGSYTLRIEANDGLGGIATTDFTLVVNVPPSVLNPIPNQNAQVLRNYNFTIPVNTFVDIDGNRLIYSITQSSSLPLPSWLTFLNITLKGVPQVSDAGQLNLLVLADDGHGGQASTAFSLNINIPPSVNQIFPVQQGLIGQPLSFVLPSNLFSGSDPNSVLTATLANGSPLPGWLTFDSASRRFSGTPVHGSVGTLLIKVTDTDSTGASVSEVIEIVIPNQPPVTVNSIPDTQASVWRLFELIVPSTTFADPDGNTLTYQAQLQGNLSLPHWLNFEANTRLFSGKPGLLDTSDLTVDVIVNDGEAQTSTQFRIAMNLSTAFQDIATYYSASGGGLVVLSLIARILRWYQMKRVHTMLKKLVKTEEESIDGADEKASDVNKEYLQSLLENLQGIVQARNTEKLQEHTTAYLNAVKTYSQKNPSISLMTMGNLRGVIKEICQEIQGRNLRKIPYSNTLIWAESLHQLFQLIVEVETARNRPILKADKEELMAIIYKANRYTDINKLDGVKLKQRLDLAQEALVCMDDTDSFIDNLCCRDNEMFVEIIKTMLAPPYGVVRLIYQMRNVPGGWNPWYVTMIQLCHLAERAMVDPTSLTKLQTTLKRQSHWHVAYEGVGLLGKVARQTHDEKLRQQAIEGGSDKTKMVGLRYYQKFNRFWVQRCTGPGCDNHSAWIRNRADTEAEETAKTSRTPVIKIQNLNSEVVVEMSPVDRKEMDAVSQYQKMEL